MRAHEARRVLGLRANADPAELKHTYHRLVVESAVRAIGALNVVQGAGELGSVFCRGDTELKHLVLDIVERSGTRFLDTLMVGLRDDDGTVRRRCLSLYVRATAERRRQKDAQRGAESRETQPRVKGGQ